MSTFVFVAQVTGYVIVFSAAWMTTTIVRRQGRQLFRMSWVRGRRSLRKGWRR